MSLLPRDTAVILLHFKDLRVTRASLERLHQCYPNPEAPRVFVVENGTTAGVPSGPLATVLHLPQNIGYGAGNNVGIRAALRGGAKFVVLLNADVRVDAGWLEAMCVAAEGPNVGLVGAVLQEPEGAVYGGGVVSWATLRTTLVRAPRGTRTLDYIHGACCGITKACLERVGLMAEGYFLYWEDVEYGLRACRAGFRCAVAQTSPLQHNNQTDDTAARELKTYYRVRNALHVVDAYGTAPVRLWAHVRLPLRMLRARRRGNTAVLHALGDARRRIFGPNPRVP